jgi:metallo-beta-lactamase class B
MINLKRAARSASLLLAMALAMPAAGAQTHPTIVIDKDLQLVSLGDSVFVHVSWFEAEGWGRFSSNGLVLVRRGRALMVDTPMTNELTERLTRYLEDSLKARTAILVAGHFHDDCIGGLEHVHAMGAESVASGLTAGLCRDRGLPVPRILFDGSLSIDFEGERVECRYFGGGHTTDNVTVWIPDSGILFGGCLVRAASFQGLGNLADAVVEEWDMTVRRVLGAYPEARIVIPGHGDSGGPELLMHTVRQVEQEKSRRQP